MLEEIVFQGALAKFFFIGTKRTTLRMKWIPIGEKRSIEYQKPGMRQVAFLAIKQQGNLESGMRNRPYAFAVVLPVFSVNPQIVGYIVERHVAFSGEVPVSQNPTDRLGKV